MAGQSAVGGRARRVEVVITGQQPDQVPMTQPFFLVQDRATPPDSTAPPDPSPSISAAPRRRRVAGTRATLDAHRRAGQPGDRAGCPAHPVNHLMLNPGAWESHPHRSTSTGALSGWAGSAAWTLTCLSRPPATTSGPTCCWSRPTAAHPPRGGHRRHHLSPSTRRATGRGGLRIRRRRVNDRRSGMPARVGIASASGSRRRSRSDRSRSAPDSRGRGQPCLTTSNW